MTGIIAVTSLPTLDSARRLEFIYEQCLGSIIQVTQADTVCDSTQID